MKPRKYLNQRLKNKVSLDSILRITDARYLTLNEENTVSSSSYLPPVLPVGGNVNDPDYGDPNQDISYFEDHENFYIDSEAKVNDVATVDSIVDKIPRWKGKPLNLIQKLTDHSDVVITDLADEDVLQWDSTTSKWINTEISAFPTGKIGDIIYYKDDTDKWVTLPKGTNGHLLTLDSSLPAWKSAPIVEHKIFSATHSDTFLEVGDAPAAGDLIYFTSKWQVLHKGTTGYPLVAGLIYPDYAQLSLTVGVTGVLPIANGGTALNKVGTKGQFLATNSGATAMEWVDPPTGSLPAGSNGDILYYDTTWKTLGKGSDGRVLTMASGLPAWGAGASLPTGANNDDILVWDQTTDKDWEVAKLSDKAVDLLNTQAISGKKTFVDSLVVGYNGGTTGKTGSIIFEYAFGNTTTLLPSNPDSDISFTLPKSLPANNGDVLVGAKDGVMSWTSNAKVYVYTYCFTYSDLTYSFYTSAIKSDGTITTWVIDTDNPRTFVLSIKNISAYTWSGTVKVKGTNANGETIEETLTYTNIISGRETEVETNNAFSSITSFTLTKTSGDPYDAGVQFRYRYGTNVGFPNTPSSLLRARKVSVGNPAVGALNTTYYTINIFSKIVSGDIWTFWLK